MDQGGVSLGEATVGLLAYADNLVLLTENNCWL